MRKIFKRFSVAFVATCMLLSSSASLAYAEEETKLDQDLYGINLDVEVQKALNGISEVPVTAEMKKAFQCEYIDGDGVSTSLPVDITVSEVVEPAVYGLNSDAPTYVATAVYSTDKVGSDNAGSDNSKISAQGSLTVYWTDHPYPDDNYLRQVSGTWSINSAGAVADSGDRGYARKVNAGGTNWEPGETYYPSGNSFTYYPGYYGYSIRCDSWLYLKMGSETATVQCTYNPIT